MSFVIHKFEDFTKNPKNRTLGTYKHNEKNKDNLENLILKSLYMSFVKSRQYYILCYVTNVMYLTFFINGMFGHLLFLY